MRPRRIVIQRLIVHRCRALPVEPDSCPLCGATTTVIAESGGTFGDCRRCGVLHRARTQHLSLDEERAFYGTHQNSTNDPGYRRFLSRIADPLTEHLAPGATGLDFGCGPAPALVAMMNERGFATMGHDPLFAPHPAALTRQYDFVTCTEVAEHFREPAREWERLVALLKPGGILAVMTEWYRGGRPVCGWRYARDPTHVVFYRKESFHWLAQNHGLSATFPRAHVCFLAARTPLESAQPPSRPRDLEPESGHSLARGTLAAVAQRTDIMSSQLAREPEVAG